MNKEKLERYLKKTHISLTKELVDASIIIALVFNAALYYFFRNNIETIISAVLFVVFSITLIRNRNYLKDYDSSLLVKTSTVGYAFWLVLMLVILLQLKFKISLWFYVLEFLLLIVSVIITKRAHNKMFEEDKYNIDYSSYKQSPLKMVSVVVCVNLFFGIFKTAFQGEIVWYILSSLIFVIVFFMSQLFISNLLVYLGYLKYFGAEE